VNGGSIPTTPKQNLPSHIHWIQLENCVQSLTCHSIHCFSNYFRGLPGGGAICCSGVNKSTSHHQSYWYRQFIAYVYWIPCTEALFISCQPYLACVSQSPLSENRTPRYLCRHTLHVWPAHAKSGDSESLVRIEYHNLFYSSALGGHPFCFVQFEIRLM
jgi:hypothetical protein